MLIIDAHVHIYECFDIDLFFDCAYKNMRKHACIIKREHDFCGVLLLAEKSDQNFFKTLKKTVEQDNTELINRWRVTLTDEPFTLKLTTITGETLFLVQGRQLKSEEGLEVLSLVSDREVEGNRPLQDLVKEVHCKHGIPVIPWAFGKWFGRRGRVLKSFVDRKGICNYFLGDNGGRPSFYYPGLLAEYKKRNAFKILSGSDPLPLRNEEERVGSFGVYVDKVPDQSRIGGQIYELLLDSDCKFIGYGKTLSVYRFLHNQFSLRRNQKVRPV